LPDPPDTERDKLADTAVVGIGVGGSLFPARDRGSSASPPRHKMDFPCHSVFGLERAWLAGGTSVRASLIVQDMSTMRRGHDGRNKGLLPLRLRISGRRLVVGASAATVAPEMAACKKNQAAETKSDCFTVGQN
jgi:hypothetical protein